MRANPALLNLLFWENSPAPKPLASALYGAFNLEKASPHKTSSSNNFDVLLVYGPCPDLPDEVTDNLPVIVIQHKNEENFGSIPGVTYLEIDGISPPALIEFIKLKHECWSNSVQLKKTSERLTSAGRVTNDILWDWDLESGLLFYNSAGWMKIIGNDIHRGKISFEQWLEFVHEDDKQFVREQFGSIIADHAALTFEVDYRMVSKSGFIYVTERGYVERDENGIAHRLVGSTQDVTGKRIAEEELKKLSTVVRETAYSVLITDTNCRITWVNKSFTHLTGYSLQEVKGKIAYDFLFYSGNGFDDCDDFATRMLKAEPFEQDLLIQPKNGERVWVRINCQPQYDIDNNPSGFFAVIADVTAQKRAEEKLMQNEKKFRVLVGNIQDGLALIDAEGEVIEFFSGQRILGYDLEDYSSGAVKKNIHHDHQNAVDQALQKVIEDPNKPSRVEFRVKRKTGEYTWIETIFYNLLNEDPLYAILANFREIRESKHAEHLLRQSEKKYRNLFNNNPLAMFVWDPKTLAILEANEATSIQYGYGLEELKKMSIPQLIHSDMEERMKAVARSSIGNSNFRTSYLTRHVDKEGRVMHMEVSFHSIDYFGSRATMAIVKNITEQVELEKRLSRERELKQQEITQAVVTAQEHERLHIGRELHDNINQILATVRLYIEYALSNSAMHDQLLKSAKELVLSAVNEIRNLSKSLLPPTVGEKGLAASLDDLFNSIRKINKYSFNTKWDMDEDILPENLKLTVFRIMQEQLTNIFKHARASKINASITMTNGQLVVKMSDDGRGFDPAVNGKGVGLKNIRSRAELHNGEMRLKTVEGQGTELTVSFKLLQ